MTPLLVLCFAMGGERPKTFEAATATMLMTFTRVKK